MYRRRLGLVDMAIYIIWTIENASFKKFVSQKHALRLYVTDMRDGKQLNCNDVAALLQPPFVMFFFFCKINSHVIC